jgi:hypothetical protein
MSATVTYQIASPEVNRNHQRNTINQARRLARVWDMRISKSRKRLSVRNFGGYRIDHCSITAGSRYSLSPDDCLEFLLKLVEIGNRPKNNAIGRP